MKETLNERTRGMAVEGIATDEIADVLIAEKQVEIERQREKRIK